MFLLLAYSTNVISSSHRHFGTDLKLLISTIPNSFKNCIIDNLLNILNKLVHTYTLLITGGTLTCLIPKIPGFNHGICGIFVTRYRERSRESIFQDPGIGCPSRNPQVEKHWCTEISCLPRFRMQLVKKLPFCGFLM